MSGFPQFYLSAYCGNCDEEILYGPCLTLIEHEGLPVVPYDMAGQTNFPCGKCGATNYTGDFEMLTEGGEET